MTKSFDIYTAGFIDGEGSICLDRRNSKSIFRHPAIHITSSTKIILDDIQAKYGGYIYKEKKRQAHHKQTWKLAIKNDKAIKCIKHVLPYMREPDKVRRAQLIIDNSYLFLPMSKMSGLENKRFKLEKDFFNKIINKLGENIYDRF